MMKNSSGSMFAILGERESMSTYSRKKDSGATSSSKSSSAKKKKERRRRKKQEQDELWGLAFTSGSAKSKKSIPSAPSSLQKSEPPAQKRAPPQLQKSAPPNLQKSAPPAQNIAPSAQSNQTTSFDAKTEEIIRLTGELAVEKMRVQQLQQHVSELTVELAGARAQIAQLEATPKRAPAYQLF